MQGFDVGKRIRRTHPQRPRRAHTTFARRLALTTLVPVLLGISAFGFFAERRARSLLEDELGRRLAMSAVAVAVQILPEQVEALSAGDEGSRNFANIRHKLVEGQARLGLRRIMVVSADLQGRGDSHGRVALGANAYEIFADEPEIRAALAGTPSSSPLFTGVDGLPYRRAYAAVGAPGDAVGVVMAEGNATYYESLKRFRRWLFVWGGGLFLVLIVAVAIISRRITGPVGRLSTAADRIGQGDLAAPVLIETRDEIGVLAERLEQMRQSLAARDERMQMMLSGIAHEVRNPLGGLELFAGLLREGLDGQPERLNEVKNLQREITHLDSVVNDFLDYARRPVLVRTEVPIVSLFQEVKEAAGSSGSVVRIETEPTQCVNADHGQLRRVLLNLVRNALQAAPQGPVVLHAHTLGAQSIIEVRDAGPGVPDDLRDKVFAPFFTTRQKGTGLGLAFAREIVVEHKGTLDVHAAPEGGACFRITL